ncbi:hypothetical protein T4A_11709 [Trichinella pseudospiralis]|uniref:Uncharacterized protein n=2 Tax=Trichinella pseudospiralis TaxID=6337 RepID=A0A0V1DRL6_TRIPS|nr:hypothetical protein T4A_11709 [Trichinella pseudospiralis]
MFYRGNNIVHARRRDHLMWRRYWSQVILDHMAQKGTKREFDISGKLGFLIIQRDWHKCRGHCSNILYINMLAIEHEEYSILISETFGQAAGKLNLSERIRRVNNEQSLCIFSYCYYIFVVNLLCMVSGCFQMKCFYNITDVIVNAMLNSSLKHCKYEFAMFSFIV